MNTTIVTSPESCSNTKMDFGKRGWGLIFYSIFMYFCYAGWTADGLNIFTVAYGHHYGWDPALLLSLATPGALVGVVGSFVFGNIIMKKGPRFVFICCLVFFALAIIWFGRISNLWEYAVAFAVMNFFGAGSGFVAPSTLITIWFPTKKGIALGWATMGFPLATAVFVPLIAFMFGVIGIANATAIWGIILIIFAVIAYCYVADNPEKVGCAPDNEPISAEATAANLKELECYISPFTLKKLLKDKDMWLIGLGFGCLWMVTVGIVVQLVPRLTSIGYSQNTAIMLLSAAAVCALPGSVMWGWIDQKFGTRVAGMYYGAVYILTLLLLINQTGNTAITFITIVFVGMGLGGIKNLVSSMIGSVYGRYDFTAANRIILPIAIIIRTFAFALMGIALALTKGFSGAYMAFIVVDIIGIILIKFITRSCKGKMS